MNKRPAFQEYAKDRLLDPWEASLTDAQLVIYYRLRSLGWVIDGLPLEITDVAGRIGRSPKEVKSAWETLSERFEKVTKPDGKQVYFASDLLSQWQKNSVRTDEKGVPPEELSKIRSEAVKSRWNKAKGLNSEGSEAPSGDTKPIQNPIQNFVSDFVSPPRAYAATATAEGVGEAKAVAVEASKSDAVVPAAPPGTELKLQGDAFSNPDPQPELLVSRKLGRIAAQIRAEECGISTIEPEAVDAYTAIIARLLKKGHIPHRLEITVAWFKGAPDGQEAWEAAYLSNLPRNRREHALEANIGSYNGRSWRWWQQNREMAQAAGANIVEIHEVGRTGFQPVAAESPGVGGTGILPVEAAAPPELDPNFAAWWQRALAHPQPLTDPENFNTWLSPIRPCALVDGAALLQVPSPFYASWLGSNYRMKILTALQDTAAPGDEVTTITFQVAPAAAESGRDA